MDLLARVDKMLETPKTILGPPQWKVAKRPEAREMRRALLEDGEFRGATLISLAYPQAHKQEYRHLIVFQPEGGKRKDARCVARLDFAPETDGAHVNDFAGPTGYPACQVPDAHYHDWAGNRHLVTTRDLPQKLLYAREIGSRIKDIDDAFF